MAIFKNMPRLFRLVWQATPGALMVSVVLTLTSSLLPAAQIYISKLIVDEVVALVAASTAMTLMVQALLPLVVGGFGILALQAILQQLDAYTTQVMSDRFLLFANTQMLEQATLLDLAHYESPEFHEIRSTRMG